MNKKSLTETDIRTKFITPNIVAARWNIDTQVREEVHFTDGRIYVRGRIHPLGERKRADYILYSSSLPSRWSPNPLKWRHSTRTAMWKEAW
jgi:type I restriction enzyme R subunit